MSSRLSAAAALSAALTLAAATASAQDGALAAASAPDARTIVHVLNRLGFGPAPGDVERVQRIGLAAWIDRQLNPGSIDDAALEERLAAFTTIRMSSRELAQQYFLPAALSRQRRAQQAKADPDMMADPRPAAQTDQRRVLLELSEQKILRAIYSERQLEEVMVDFWFNHFNVFAGKGPTRNYVTEFERDTIRPHALGRFRDLLGAVAESPAMLFFLDNWQSAAPQAQVNRSMQRRRGLNENYARELLELHTLGVDGGYTQTDVQEVARAFTGWTIDMPRAGGGFRFQPRLHDDGEKLVLGVKIPTGGGKRDGDMVLDLLARHPSTARFVATKLVRRFVSDDPPPTLVARAAARFRDTDGDIRDVVRAIVTSAEFFATHAQRAKVKTPLEFVASAVRATGADVRSAAPLVQTLRQLGMPPYLCQPPTGYAETADAWVNTGALLNRMNFAVALAGNPRWTVRSAAPVTAAQVSAAVMADHVSPETRATVASAGDRRQALALLLGSPDFQRR